MVGRKNTKGTCQGKETRHPAETPSSYHHTQKHPQEKADAKIHLQRINSQSIHQSVNQTTVEVLS